MGACVSTATVGTAVPPHSTNAAEPQDKPSIQAAVNRITIELHDGRSSVVQNTWAATIRVLTTRALCNMYPSSIDSMLPTCVFLARSGSLQPLTDIEVREAIAEAIGNERLSDASSTAEGTPTLLHVHAASGTWPCRAQPSSPSGTTAAASAALTLRALLLQGGQEGSLGQSIIQTLKPEGGIATNAGSATSLQGQSREVPLPNSIGESCISIG